MIKTIGAAKLRPGKRSLDDFHKYWAENHGPLFANTRSCRGYIQHLTLHDAYSGNPAPTYDGISMMWYDDVDTLNNPSQDPWDVRLRGAVTPDDRQLFDRDVSWPTHHKRTTIVAEEKPIVDGEKQPSMVKLLLVVARHPGLSKDEFFDYWLNVHGPIAAKLPGLRRYVENHAVRETVVPRPMTHDGWSEFWFDDLASLQAAWASPEGDAMRENGKTLFAEPIGVGIARERVQKWPGDTRKDWGARGLSEQQVKERLERDGYQDLAAAPAVVAKIKAAGDSGNVMVWTDQHLVVNVDPMIDARPRR